MGLCKIFLHKQKIQDARFEDGYREHATLHLNTANLFGSLITLNQSQEQLQNSFMLRSCECRTSLLTETDIQFHVIQ